MLKRPALLMVLCVSMNACVSGPGRITLRVLERRDIPGRDNFLGIPITSGQLVLTESPGGLSFFFNLAPSKFFPLTHAAILIIEAGKPFIYDISGELSTFKGLYTSVPTAAISGTVKRYDFYEYCRPNYYCAFYDPPPEIDVDKLVAFVQKCYREEKPFDPYFRWGDKEHYYCTQFIAESLKAAGGKYPDFIPMNNNKSFHKVLRWLEIPREATLPAGAFANEKRFVGCLSTFGSLSAVRGYFAAKRVIHERFTKDQRIGFLFSFDDRELQLRPHIDKFVKDAIKLVVDHASSLDENVNDRAALSLVRDLADERLGYYEAPGRKSTKKNNSTEAQDDEIPIDDSLPEDD